MLKQQKTETKLHSLLCWKGLKKSMIWSTPFWSCQRYVKKKIPFWETAEVLPFQLYLVVFWIHRKWRYFKIGSSHLILTKLYHGISKNVACCRIWSNILPGQLRIGQMNARKILTGNFSCIFNFNIAKLALLRQNNWRHGRRKGATNLSLHSASGSVLYMHVPRLIFNF